MSKKILILYTSVGLGHKTVAENIGQHLKDAGFEVLLDDILKIQSGRLIDVSKKIYMWLINSAPWFWRFLYNSKFLTDLSLPLRTKVAGSDHYQRTKKLVEEFQPDAIITTHPAPSAVIAYLKQQGIYKKPFGISFSDFHLHRYWVYKEADFYLANIEEHKQELIQMGFPADKILINGIPLMAALPLERNAMRAKLGLTSAKTILVTAGSLGFGINKKFIVDLLSGLEQRISDFTMILVSGKDQQVYKELSSIQHPKLKVFGYYSPMDELYTVADVFVGKPGGLSTTEALCKHLPIIITHWMPGGEDHNVAYLTKNRLTLPVNNPGSNRKNEIIEEVVNELSTGDFRRHLKSQTALIESIANTDPNRVGGFIRRLIG